MESWAWSSEAEGGGAWLALVALLRPLALHGDEALWARLKAGGHVILMRHPTTDPGIGDPPGFRLGDRSTRRNLSETGRIEARGIGDAFARRSIPVGEVRSSRGCRFRHCAARVRTRGTLAWAVLDSVFADSTREPEQTAAVKTFVLDYGDGPNAVFVTHAVNIAVLVGPVIAQGEMAVVRREHDRVKLVGHLRVD